MPFQVCPMIWDRLAELRSVLFVMALHATKALRKSIKALGGRGMWPGSCFFAWLCALAFHFLIKAGLEGLGIIERIGRELVPSMEEAVEAEVVAEAVAESEVRRGVGVAANVSSVLGQTKVELEGVGDKEDEDAGGSLL
jgi:hypothetical protein